MFDPGNDSADRVPKLQRRRITLDEDALYRRKLADKKKALLRQESEAREEEEALTEMQRKKEQLKHWKLLQEESLVRSNNVSRSDEEISEVELPSSEDDSALENMTLDDIPPAHIESVQVTELSNPPSSDPDQDSPRENNWSLHYLDLTYLVGFLIWLEFAMRLKSYFE